MNSFPIHGFEPHLIVKISAVIVLSLLLLTILAVPAF